MEGMESGNQKVERPSMLYHGSANTEIGKLEPQEKSFRDATEGPQVFATPELSLATIFMSPINIESSGIFNGVPYAVIVIKREEFMKKDKGGAIYKLPTENFKCDPDKGLKDKEWTCDVPVSPQEKIQYPSVLDAMIENGVQVYFVDKESHERIKKADDNGLSILTGLESENQRHGVNYTPLPRVEDGNQDSK